MVPQMDKQEQAKLMRLLNTPLAQINKQLAEKRLAEFQRQMWETIDTHDYIHGWHIDAICEHLEAVLARDLLRLVINIPPRHMKSINVCVGFPAWSWIREPMTQFLYASYAASLSTRDNMKCRRVIQSPLYQAQWGDRFTLTSDQNTKTRFDNDKGGYRIATSVDGTATGEGGDIIVIDDANNVKEIESDTIRDATNIWFDETMQTRFNDPKRGALVAIQQRTHALDLTGHIQRKYGEDYCYLVLPARHELETRRKKSLRTFHGWTDPRKKEGELLWPDRFGDDELKTIEKGLGIYGTAGQLQQRPSPRDGGIVPVADFQKYEKAPSRDEWIKLSFSIDTAAKEQEIHDPSSIEVWAETQKGSYLLFVWKKKVLFPKLLKKVAAMIDDWKPTEVLIEDKSSGTSLIQCLRSKEDGDKYGYENIVAIDPGAFSKTIRMENEAVAIENGMVYIPARTDIIVDNGMTRYATSWVTDFEDECVDFPNGAHDEQVDAMSQYLKRQREKRQRRPQVAAPIVHSLTSSSHWHDEDTESDYA